MYLTVYRSKSWFKKSNRIVVWWEVRNADVDRPVDEVEIENLDQPNDAWLVAGLAVSGPGQCGGRGSSTAEARNTLELWRPGSTLIGHRLTRTTLTANHLKGQLWGEDRIWYSGKDKTNKLYIHKLDCMYLDSRYFISTNRTLFSSFTIALYQDNSHYLENN